MNKLKNTVKRISALIAALLYIQSGILAGVGGKAFSLAVYAETLPKPEISSEAAVVLNADTGEVLYGKNENKRYNPASITKIMTALLVLEKADLDGELVFSSSAVSNLDTGAVTLGAKAGDRLKVKAALYGLMLKSANEVANALAEYTAGSTKEFAKLMTARAKELGAKNTNFVNAHGLTDSNHYTSAYDMALITKAAFENPTFRDIEATTTYTFPALGSSPARVIGMGHKMVHKSDSRYYEGILGGKTGYTRLAGNTLVTVVQRKGVRLIVVVLKSQNTHYQDTKALLDYGFSLSGVSVSGSTAQTGGNTAKTGGNGVSAPTNSPSDNPATNSADKNLVGPGADIVNTSSTKDNLTGPGQISNPENLKTGWNLDGRGWRYLRENNNLAVSEVLDIKGETYWFDSDTYMAVGWRKDLAGNWYYMREEGQMRKSKWILYNNLWYYVGQDGKMLTDTTTPDGYKVNKDGVWIK